MFYIFNAETMLCEISSSDDIQDIDGYIKVESSESYEISKIKLSVTERGNEIVERTPTDIENINALKAKVKLELTEASRYIEVLKDVVEFQTAKGADKALKQWREYRAKLAGLTINGSSVKMPVKPDYLK